MPTVEKTTGGRVYIRPLERRFEIGDQAEVSSEDAEYLVEERGDFEVVDPAASTDADADGAAESDLIAGAFEAGNWLDREYQARANAVLAGRVDSYLDDIEAAETSDTVLEAVADRRSELEA